MAHDLLTRIRSELEQRMAELRPLLSEYERLIDAADTLEAIDHQAAATGDSPAGTPSGASISPAAPRRRARAPRGAGAGAIERAASPLAAVEATESAAPAASVAGTRERAAPTPSARTPSTPTPGASTETRWHTPPGPAAAEMPEQAPLPPEDEEPKRAPASPDAIQQAILAALEHGSHTVSELVMVTAEGAPDIRGNLRRLARRGKLTKVRRDGDGKTAYALSSAHAQA